MGLQSSWWALIGSLAFTQWLDKLYIIWVHRLFGVIHCKCWFSHKPQKYSKQVGEQLVMFKEHF